MECLTPTKWVGRIFGLAVFNAAVLTILGITGRAGSNPEMTLFVYVVITGVIVFLD